jgi:tRNA 2-selenouridine synthase
MGVVRIGIDDAVASLSGFDAVIDARSPAEHADDHLPGAVNWPSLDDEERRIVGTEYAQISPFEARKRGAALVARNIARHLEREMPGLPRSWRPLVYCWRGGQRSGALALVLGQIGFEVAVLEGGYRAFRRRVIADLETLPGPLPLRMVCGRTGSGKSRLLGALAQAGAQVLDLEALAAHRGSVLGAVPGQPQPSQKRFESRLWQALRGMQADRPVWVESESRTIGRLRVPEALLQRMRAAPCVRVEMPLEARVQLLMEDYTHLAQAPEQLCERLQALREVRGAAVVEDWVQRVRGGRVEEVVEDLLVQHYDPVYERSMARNFAGFGAAVALSLADGATATLQRAVADLAGP